MRRAALGAAVLTGVVTVSAVATRWQSGPGEPAGACREDAAELVRNMRLNYAGYDDSAARIGTARLAEIEDEVIQGATATGAACDRHLWSYIARFQDRHFGFTSDFSRRTDYDDRPPRPDFPCCDPTFEALSDSTSLVRIPTFNVDYLSAVDSMVDAHEDEIRARPNLIVDVRGNGGGADATYGPVFDILYGGPFTLLGVRFLATPENRDQWLQVLEGLPEEAGSARGTVQRLVEAMDGIERELIDFFPERTVTRPRVWATPRRVAVIIDQWCGSSCDQFAMEAEYSSKVTLLGAPTSGVLDYSNLVPLELPSGRSFSYPTSRSNRLDADGGSHGGRIRPAVTVPEATLRDLEDGQAWVLEWIENG